MKKITAILLMVLSFSTMLYGCASDKKSDDTEAATNDAVTADDIEVADDTETAALEESETVSYETEYPLTIDIYGPDGTKYTQTYAAVPTKVITNMPSATDLLLELGLQDKIVGILSPDNAPAEKWAEAYNSLTVIADKKTVSKEVIVGAEPDLVIGRAMPFTDDTMGTVNFYNDMGIPVYIQVASNFELEQSLDNIIVDIKNVGKIFNVQEKANAYADELQQRLDNIMNQVSQLPEQETIKVLYMVTYADQTFNSFGANSVLQESMLSLLNAENVLETGSGSLTNENLIALNPDVIVYITSDKNALTDENAVETLLNDSIIQSVPAIANGKIITIAYDDLMDYGTRLFDTLEVLYDFMY